MKTQDVFIVHPSNEEQVTVLKAFLEAHTQKIMLHFFYTPKFKKKLISYIYFTLNFYILTISAYFVTLQYQKFLLKWLLQSK